MAKEDPWAPFAYHASLHLHAFNNRATEQSSDGTTDDDTWRLDRIVCRDEVPSSSVPSRKNTWN